MKHIASNPLLRTVSQNGTHLGVFPANGTDEQRHGVVLIVVLVLVVMMALAGFAFMNRMATEYEATLINGDLRQAQQTLSSAETYLIHLAKEYAGASELDHPFTDDPELFSAQIVEPASSDFSDVSQTTTPRSRRWRFSVVNSLSEVSAEHRGQENEFQDIVPQPLMQFGLNNESGKLHLGRVMLWESEDPGTGRETLLQIPGMTQEAADSILDWIDADDEPREFGAEQEHYSQLDRPIEPRNGLPESHAELLFVKGVTRDAFHGNGPTSEWTSTSSKAWTDLLTIHSAEPNTDRFGNRRFNLNEVDPAVYADESTVPKTSLTFLPQELAAFILLARRHGIAFPPEDVNGSTILPSPAPAAARLKQHEIQHRSGEDLSHGESLDLEQIVSLADLIESSVQLPVVDGGDLVESPLQTDSTDFLETMKLLEERVTVDSDDTLIGRININTAPIPVLQALIGDAGVATQIVQQRRVVDRSQKATTAWLLTQQVMDLPTYRRIYPHITTRGAVHSGEIVVYRQFGGPFLRRKLIIDASSSPARRVDWTDLTQHGLPVRISDLQYWSAEW